MFNKEIFEVTREDYKNFIQTLKPEARDIKENKVDNNHVAVEIYSLKNNKCLASRVYNIEHKEPEQYYIFELPDTDESLPPIPKRYITLTTKEEVQKFFDYFLKREKKND